MSKYKSLLKQTAIYGLSSILMRLLSWFLTPYYTREIPVEAVGIFSDLSAMIALINIVYMLGMETSFFRFSKEESNAEDVFKTSNTIVFLNSILFSSLFILFATPIVNLLQYPGKEVYIYLLSITLFLENSSNISFAHLRFENKSLQFMWIRVFNVIFNIALNFYFISFVYKENLPETSFFKDPVSLILLANLIPWFLTFLYFSKKIFKHLALPSKALYSEMMAYSKPLLIVGIAGMVNETLDRSMLKYLLPFDIHENLRQVGFYSANYKLSIIMTLAIQSFRMGAEPFFFKESKNKNAPTMYATIMDFFIIGCCIILVLTGINQNLISNIMHSSYKEGLVVLPYLLLANLFLGVFYNSTVWFKVTDKTKFGAIIALIGAGITLVLNFILIPIMGYMGSAIATLVCYFTMMCVSLYWGRKHYPIPYHYGYNVLWILLSSILVFSFQWFHWELSLVQGILASLLFLTIALYVAYIRFLKFKHQERESNAL